MQTIYQQLEPDTTVIECYHRDFTFHDLESFNAAKDGDAAIWSAGPCGTHIAFTHRAGKPVKSPTICIRPTASSSAVHVLVTYVLFMSHSAVTLKAAISAETAC